MNSTLQALIITLGIFAIAGLFALFEPLGDRSKWLKREEAERTRTTGVIVGFDEERHRYRRRRSLNAHYVIVYYPIVRFRADGVEYELKSTSIVPRDKYPEGQSVDLLYDPNNPNHFHLDRGDAQERFNRGTIIFIVDTFTRQEKTGQRSPHRHTVDYATVKVELDGKEYEVTVHDDAWNPLKTGESVVVTRGLFGRIVEYRSRSAYRLIVCAATMGPACLLLFWIIVKRKNAGDRRGMGS